MWCGLCDFLIIKPQTALHHAVWCDTVHYYLRCGYAILRAVLVRFVQFMRFSEHPYYQQNFIVCGLEAQSQGFLNCNHLERHQN